jgi:hypothetical protein
VAAVRDSAGQVVMEVGREEVGREEVREAAGSATAVAGSLLAAARAVARVGG